MSTQGIIAMHSNSASVCPGAMPFITPSMRLILSASVMKFRAH